MHLRYNCTTQDLWIITYVLYGLDLDTTNPGGSMWAKKCEPGTDDCEGASGTKFVQYSGTIAGGNCDASCTSAPACGADGKCAWCCNDMWPIVNTTASGTTEWIGWMARVKFDHSKNATYTQFNAHFDAVEESSSKTSASTLRKKQIQGLCLDCTAGEAGLLVLTGEQMCSPATALSALSMCCVLPVALRRGSINPRAFIADSSCAALMASQHPSVLCLLGFVYSGSTSSSS